jgi:hypothetical protein
MGRISRRLVDCHPRRISGRNAEHLGRQLMYTTERQLAMLHWLPPGAGGKSGVEMAASPR